MRYFTDSAILLLYSMLAFFYVPADQALVFSLLFTVILGCVTYLCRASETESWSHNSLPVLKRFDNRILVLTGSYVIFGFSSLWIPNLLLFFPLLLYQTLSAGLFCSCSKFLSQILKIVVKNFSEIVPGKQTQKEGFRPLIFLTHSMRITLLIIIEFDPCIYAVKFNFIPFQVPLYQAADVIQNRT